MTSDYRGCTCVLLALATPLTLAAGAFAAPPPATHSTDEGYLGVVLPRRTVELAPSLEGKLADVCVGLGDHVDKGDVVGVLESQAVLSEFFAVRASELRAREQRRRAEAVLEEAERRYERTRRLFEEQNASEDELQLAKLAVKVAERDLGVAEAGLKEQRARLEQAQRQRAETFVLAPFAGSVAARYQDPGAWVGPLTPIVRLISSDDLWVRFAVPEDELKPIKPGAAISVCIAAVDAIVPGWIERVAPEVDSASRMVLVEARLARQPAGERRVKCGMKARVYIHERAGHPTTQATAEPDDPLQP